MLLVMFSAQIARAACSASFTRSISGLTVTFTNTSTTSGTVPSAVHYNWWFSDGTSSTLKDPVKTFATSGSKTAYLSIYDSSTHCSSSYVDTFIVVGLGGACGANFTKTVGISGLTLTFNNTSLSTNGTTSGLSYYWYFSDGTSSMLKNPTKTFATGGYKTIQLTITDSAQGCFSSKMDSIVLTPSSGGTCTASFTKTISGLSVAYNNTSTSSGSMPSSVYYYWYFSDGTSSSLKNPVKTFTTPGSKSVMLTIYDSSTSCTHTVTDTLLISGSACAAHFTATISGLNVGLVNHSLNTNGTNAGLSYYWYFSDGSSSTAKNLVKTFTTIGYKTIQLTITDSSQGCFSTMNDTILLPVITNCAAIFTKSITGLTATFTNASKNNNGSAAGLSYNWYFSDGTSSTQKNPVKTFSSAGIKVATLSISDSSTGCSSSKTDSFFVATSACAASFTKTVSGLTVSFNNTSLNTNGSASGLQYLWNFGDGTTSTLKNPVKTYATSGVKVVLLSISDSSQGCFATKTDTIIIGASTGCQASFLFPLVGPLSIQCTSTSTNNNGTTSGLSYLWTFSDGTTAVGATVAKTFASAGVKWVRLNIGDSATGCFASRTDSFMLTAPSSCAASFTKTVSGLTVSFTNTSLNTNGSSTGLNYLWNFGDGTSSTLKNPVKTFSSGGPKIVQLSISDSSQGCSATAYDSLFLVPPPPLCSASFVLAVDTTTPFHFFLLNTSIIRTTSTFYWSFGDGGSSTLMTPTHTYANFGIYYVCLTVADSICTSTYCDSIGMDSTGKLLKQGAFGFQTLDFTTLSTATGIAEVGALPEYSIYPNPASADVHVDFNLKTATHITYQLTDITGKVVFSQTINTPPGQHSETIDIGSLKPSIYFLNIMSPEGSKNYKLIKN